MGLTPSDDAEGSDSDERENPEVPEGVLRGIEDIEDGTTASKENLESVLK